MLVMRITFFNSLAENLIIQETDFIYEKNN
jgi:hypothetical protein